MDDNDLEASKKGNFVHSGKDEMDLQHVSTRPKNFRQFWRGETAEESRIPIWHEELRHTRRVIAKEWVGTSTQANFQLLLPFPADA